jgi:hypothetical protein
MDLFFVNQKKIYIGSDRGVMTSYCEQVGLMEYWLMGHAQNPREALRLALKKIFECKTATPLTWVALIMSPGPNLSDIAGITDAVPVLQVPLVTPLTGKVGDKCSKAGCCSLYA